LLRAISLNNLTWYLVKAAKDGSCCSMLTVNNGIETAFDWCDNHRRELRPVKVFRDMLNV